jgi:hypothetical protein
VEPITLVPRSSPTSGLTGLLGDNTMRLLFGIILGFALTVGGVYVADQASTRADARPMVNWDVVAKNVDQITTMARDGWRRISG